MIEVLRIQNQVVAIQAPGLLGDLMLDACDPSQHCTTRKVNLVYTWCLAIFGGTGRHNRCYVALSGCVETVMVMSADVWRHALTVVIVLVFNTNGWVMPCVLVSWQ